MSSGAPRTRLVDRDERDPLRGARRPRSTSSSTLPRPVVRRTFCPSVTPSRSRSNGCTNSRGPRTSSASDGDATTTRSDPYSVRPATSRRAYASTGTEGTASAFGAPVEELGNGAQPVRCPPPTRAFPRPEWPLPGWPLPGWALREWEGSAPRRRRRHCGRRRTRSHRRAPRAGARRRRGRAGAGRRRRRRTRAPRWRSPVGSPRRFRGRSRTRSGARALEATRHAGIAVRSGVTLRPSRCTRPSRLEPVPACSPHSVVGSTMSGPRRGGVGERADADDDLAVGERGAGERAVGEFRERIGVDEDERFDATIGRGAEDAGGVEAAQLRYGTPRGGEVLVPGIERDAAGQEAGCEAEVESAVDIGARQGAEEAARPGPRRASRRRGRTSPAGCATDPRPRTTTIGPSRPSRPRAMSSTECRPVISPASATRERRDRRPLLARKVAQHGGRVLREPVVARRDVDQRHVEVDGGAPHAQVQDRELLLEIRSDEHDGLRPVEVGDRRAGQAEHDLGRQPVTELRVHVVGAEHTLREARPRVRVLVRARGPTEHCDRARSGTPEDVAQRVGGRVERFGPGRLDELRRGAAPGARPSGRPSGRTRSRSGPCRTANPG